MSKRGEPPTVVCAKLRKDRGETNGISSKCLNIDERTELVKKKICKIEVKTTRGEKREEREREKKGKREEGEE
jgi:hypothetical protein